VASITNRSQYFDNAKLILIFLVVFGHVISPLKGNDKILFTLYTVIFLFHMPAFIFISGLFSKGYRKKGFLFKSIKKILLPYLIFQAIYSVFYYYNGDESKLKINLLQPHWTLWFLLSLFCWNLLLIVFGKLRWFGLAIAVAIGIGAGYFNHIGGYLSLSRTFVFFPYFLLGFLLEKEHIKNLAKAKFSVPLGLVIISVTMVIFGVAFPKDAVSWLLGSESYAGMGQESVWDGFIRAGQYALTLIVTFGFLALVPEGGFKLTVIGQRTLYVYLLHGFIIKTIEAFVPGDTLNSFSQNYLMLLVFSGLICLLLGSYFTKKYTRPLIELHL
jgi:fucose 4-O-acetylase-like acetyltransferase